MNCHCLSVRNLQKINNQNANNIQSNTNSQLWINLTEWSRIKGRYVRCIPANKCLNVVDRNRDGFLIRDAFHWISVPLQHWYMLHCWSVLKIPASVYAYCKLHVWCSIWTLGSGGPANSWFFVLPSIHMYVWIHFHNHFVSESVH